MSLTAGNTALSSDITAFKNAVKNEMQRRQTSNSPYTNTGIPTSYAGNFSDSASQGATIKASHYNQTVGYINTYFPIGWDNVSSGAKLNSVWDIYNYVVNGISKDNIHTGTPHCREYCRGLCSTACTGDCDGWCTVAHGNCSNYRAWTCDNA